MPCADAASRKYEWENSVSRFCQVKNRFVEPHIDEASNIFPKHPTGPQFGNNAAHFRPQVAFIRKAPPFSGGGEGLAWKAAGENRDGFKSCFLKKRLLRECGDVPELRHVRPVPLQDGIGVVRPFTLADGLEPGRLRRQVQTADAGEQAHMGQSLHTSSPSRSPSSWGSSTSSRRTRLWRRMMDSSRTSWAALLSSGRPRLRKSFFSTFS